MNTQLPKKSSKFFNTNILQFCLTIFGAIIISAVYYIHSTSSLNKAAVVTNGIECASLGRKIFDLGGNVADVAVTVILCEGVASPQSSGIGGGFFLSYYSKSEGIVRTLNARETAPAAATTDMYVNDTNSAVSGGKAVAVPGEIKGLWELHQKFGSLEWKILLQPVIELCKEGHVVSNYLQDVFARYEERIFNEPSLREIFIDPETNKLYKEGEKVKRLKLAETLEIIARDGANAIYGGGEIGRMLIEDVQKMNGILTEEDLMNYEVKWSTSLTSKIINNQTLHTFPIPSSGAIINFIFNVLSNYKLSHDSLSYHRIIEAFKFAYAKRSYLGDENSTKVLEMMENLLSQSYANEISSKINDTKTFNNPEHYEALYGNIEDKGTSHISILAPNGDAISVTSTINYYFGAIFRAQQTGIILNNQMDDFSTPGILNIYEYLPSPMNFIKPGKRALSSMTPTFIIDAKGNIRMIVGAEGGSRTPTSIFASIFNHLYLKKSLKDAIGTRRLHHQLFPPQLQFETNFDDEILKDLNENFGHLLLENTQNDDFAAVTVIAVNNGKIEASFDPRRGGSVEIFSALSQINTILGSRWMTACFIVWLGIRVITLTRKRKTIEGKGQYKLMYMLQMCTIRLKKKFDTKSL
ncbi:hypothetical protein PVAND_014835 [Polypedilum vanderplanki]|uniref:Uncharacterized protein n=1 Tax=Polypedilum vanderplanki TaxID=319348 RepID=A0A9J6BAD0_POLVA|nr:hypothetical protein PVAND_014835 [Polypedilum vanderplanki]